MLIPSYSYLKYTLDSSLSRRVNANSQLFVANRQMEIKLIKKGEC